jgi:hypothetical protein
VSFDFLFKEATKLRERELEKRRERIEFHVARQFDVGSSVGESKCLYSRGCGGTNGEGPKRKKRRKRSFDT